MKKFYLMAFAAMSVMAMSSCSSSDEPNDGPEFSKTAINFDSYLGRDAKTRASVTKDVKDFGVFAFYTGNTVWKDYASKSEPNFMGNQQVTGTKSNASDWTYTYSPVKYWPNNEGERLSFFAYSPYDANAKWNYDATNKYGYLTYTVPADIKKQIDFLACLSSDATVDLVKQNDDAKISFDFKHTLSRIGFKVAYSKDTNSYDEDNNDPIDANTTVQIDSIKIGDEAVKDSGFYTTGNLNFDATGKIDWKNCLGNQAYTLRADNFNTSVANNVTNKYQYLNTDSSYIMMFPQDFTGKGFPIEIVYTVTTADDKVSDKKVTIKNTIKSVVKGMNFVAGKAYTFKLLLGLTSVKTSATIKSGWSTTDDKTVEFPQEEE